tara:strand:- start:8347 stop:8772 length:426 start_codon:yes stop_codon:yes gene_type:complete
MEGTPTSVKVARAIGAWLVADLMAGAALVFGFGVMLYVDNPAPLREVGQFLLAAIPISLYVAFLVGVMTALPMIGIVAFMRFAHMRRGLGDVLLSGVMGAVLIHLTGMQALGVEGLFTTALFFVAGMVGGFTYWHFAGRPR